MAWELGARIVPVRDDDKLPEEYAVSGIGIQFELIIDIISSRQNL
jgi:hypothetical protein